MDEDILVPLPSGYFQGRNGDAAPGFGEDPIILTLKPDGSVKWRRLSSYRIPDSNKTTIVVSDNEVHDMFKKEVKKEVKKEEEKPKKPLVAVSWTPKQEELAMKEMDRIKKEKEL